MTPVFLLITASTFAYFLCVGTLIPALPRFVEGPLAGTSVSVGLTIGAFSLAAVLCRPLVGRVGDLRGRRVLIVAGGAIVALSVVGYIWAASLPALLVLRLVTGTGEAAFYVGVASAVNDLAPDERRGEALSFFSLALFLGLAAGPILGETVLGDGHYAAVWLLAGACSLAAAGLGLRIPETRSVATAAPSGRWLNKAGLLPGAVLGAQVWGLAGFTAFVPLYALQIGMTGSRSVFAVYSVIVLLIRGFGARLPDVLGHHVSARTALTFSALGLLLMGLVADPAGLYAGTALFSIGQALAFPALMTLAVDGAPASERASVVSTFTMFFDAAFGLGAVGLGVVAAVLGYEGVFLTSSLVALGGLTGLVMLGRRGRRAEAGADNPDLQRVV